MFTSIACSIIGLRIYSGQVQTIDLSFGDQLSTPGKVRVTTILNMKTVNLGNERLQVFKAVCLCSPVNVYRRFGDSHRPHHQGRTTEIVRPTENTNVA